MSGFLLDTNVLSEANKVRPHPLVLQFFQNLAPEQAFISVLSLGELRKGAAIRLRRGAPAVSALSAWIDAVEEGYADRVLAVNVGIARLWGEFSAHRTRPIVDTLLAATAIHHGLTLVTRNTRDVLDLPVSLRNPWLT